MKTKIVSIKRKILNSEDQYCECLSGENKYNKLKIKVKNSNPVKEIVIVKEMVFK